MKDDKWVLVTLLMIIDLFRVLEAFYKDARVLNSSLHACISSTLSTEPSSPTPYYPFLYFLFQSHLLWHSFPREGETPFQFVLCKRINRWADQTIPSSNNNLVHIHRLVLSLAPDSKFACGLSHVNIFEIFHSQHLWMQGLLCLHTNSYRPTIPSLIVLV